MISVVFALAVAQANPAPPPPLPPRPTTDGQAQPDPLTPPPPALSAPPLLNGPPTLPAAASQVPSNVKIRCPSDCSVRAGGGSGRRINSQQWEFTDVTPGKVRFDIEGSFTMPIAAGYVEIPGSSEVEVLVSKNRLVLGTVTPRSAAPVAGASPKSDAPSILRVSCQKPCTVSVDGSRRSGENQMGSIAITNIAPGQRTISVKFLGSSAPHVTVDVAPDTEIFLYAQEGNLRVTNTKPLH